MYDLHDWNNKLYKDANGDWLPQLKGEWFWDNFQIKSWPQFRDVADSHIPEAWGSDVFVLITRLQKDYPSIVFNQVKEKFCQLRIYYSNAPNEEVDAIINDTISQMRIKGIHP